MKIMQEWMMVGLLEKQNYHQILKNCLKQQEVTDKLLKIAFHIIMQKYNAFGNQTLSMSNTKYPQFKSRKLSKSLSKQKYAPYTKKQNNVKFFQNPKENRLNLQPLNSHLQDQLQQTCLPRKFKLRIQNIQQRRLSTEASTNVVSRNRRWLQIEQINSYNQIMQKIQQQTSIISKSLQEMISNIAFPRDQSVKKCQKLNQKQLQSYKRQQKIIEHLQELTLNNSEILILRNINSSYQKQVDKNQQEIKSLKKRYQQLYIQHEDWKQSIKQLKKSRVESCCQTDHKQIIKISKPHQDLFQTFKQPDDFNKTQTFDQNYCSALLKKIQECDLQNQILKENIKILNYSLLQKQQEIRLLKLKIDNLNLSKKRDKAIIDQQHQNLQQDCRTSIEKIQFLKQISIPLIDNGLINQDSSKFIQKLPEKASTEITPLKLKIFQNQENTILQKRNFNELSTSMMDKHCNFEESSKTSPFYSTLFRTGSSLNKSFHKNKKRGSFMSVEQKQKLKKQKIQNEYKSNQTLEILKLIRKTISYRLKGLKTTYDNFQVQILQNYPYYVKKQEIRQILTSNIFGMSQFYASIIIKYIFKEKEIEKQVNQIQNYIFCLKMRQFISHYAILEDQQEEIVIQNIKKLLFCNFSMIKRQMQNFEHQDGIIKFNFFTKVLEDYKFNERQIDLIVSQCCIISSDINSLQYTRYFRIFQNVQ